MARRGRRGDRALRRACGGVPRLQLHRDRGARLSRRAPRRACDRLCRKARRRIGRRRAVQLPRQGDVRPGGARGVLRQLSARLAGRAPGDGRRARLRRRGEDGVRGEAWPGSPALHRRRGSARGGAAAPRRARRLRGARSARRLGARARERARVRPEHPRPAAFARDKRTALPERAERLQEPRVLRDVRAGVDVQDGDRARRPRGRRSAGDVLRLHGSLRARRHAPPLRAEMGPRSDRHEARPQGELQHVFLQPRLRHRDERALFRRARDGARREDGDRLPPGFRGRGPVGRIQADQLQPAMVRERPRARRHRAGPAACYAAPDGPRRRRDRDGIPGASPSGRRRAGRAHAAAVPGARPRRRARRHAHGRRRRHGKARGRGGRGSCRRQDRHCGGGARRDAPQERVVHRLCAGGEADGGDRDGDRERRVRRRHGRAEGERRAQVDIR